MEKAKILKNTKDFHEGNFCEKRQEVFRITETLSTAQKTENIIHTEETVLSAPVVDKMIHLKEKLIHSKRGFINWG